MYIRRIFRPAIRRKRPELLEATPLILQDNASCHKAANVQAVFAEYEWEVLPHPAYLSVLSPPDYDLFPKLKEKLRGIRYDDLDILYDAVNAVTRDMNRRCLATGIGALPRRWEYTIKAVGIILRDYKQKYDI